VAEETFEVLVDQAEERACSRAPLPQALAARMRQGQVTVKAVFLIAVAIVAAMAGVFSLKRMQDQEAAVL
jgi:hypothetical protein